MKYLFIGGVALLLAPMPPEDMQSKFSAQPVSAVQTHEFVSVAIGIFADAASFCQRQPQACEVLGEVANAAEVKAKYSIRLLYEWAGAEQSGHDSVEPALKGTLTPTSPQLNLQPPAQSDANAVQPAALQHLMYAQATAVDSIVTGSNSKPTSQQAGNVNTLKIEDLVPVWRGPASRNQG